MVHSLVDRCNAKLWTLVRLRNNGANEEQLLSVYLTRIRPVLEFASPVWFSLIHQSQANLLEGIQRKALNIILGMRASSHNKNMEHLSLPTLQERRQTLALAFARKAVVSHRHSHWFKLAPPPKRKPRLIQGFQPIPPKYVVNPTRNLKTENSPLRATK